MSGKLLYLMTTAGLFCSIGATSAREAVRLTDDQLDRVTAGTELTQTPPVASFLVNGSNGAGGINQDAQMDGVAAGAVGSAIGLADASGNLQAQTAALTLGSADSAHGNALAMGLSAASSSSLLSPAVASSLSAAIAKAP